jgi:hypothetical protein
MDCAWSEKVEMTISTGRPEPSSVKDTREVVPVPYWPQLSSSALSHWKPDAPATHKYVSVCLHCIRIIQPTMSECILR